MQFTMKKGNAKIVALILSPLQAHTRALWPPTPHQLSPLSLGEERERIDINKCAIQSRCLANFAFFLLANFRTNRWGQTMTMGNNRSLFGIAKKKDCKFDLLCVEDSYMYMVATPINYRKCHFKCRKSHNAHN